MSLEYAVKEEDPQCNLCNHTQTSCKPFWISKGLLYRWNTALTLILQQLQLLLFELGFMNLLHTIIEGFIFFPNSPVLGQSSTLVPPIWTDVITIATALHQHTCHAPVSPGYAAVFSSKLPHGPPRQVKSVSG